MDHINGFKAAVAAVLGCLTALWGWFGWLVVDGVLGLILDHIPALTLPFDYTVFLTVLVLVWYILTELGSIVENAGRLGAPLPAWLSKAIAALESGVDSTGDKLTQGEKKE